MQPEPIPAEYLDLFEKRAFAFVATLLPDGDPHVVPTWVDYDGDHLLVNVVEGSRKEKNVRKHPAVAVAIQDPDQPYRYLQVRGTVVEATAEGADEQLDDVAERYTGQPRYPRRGADENRRILLRIRPEHVTGQSPPSRGE